MSDFPTYDDLFGIAKKEVLQQSRYLKADVIDRDGTDAKALVGSSAAVGDEVMGQLIGVHGDMFLDSAKREKLDRLVYDRYGIVRKPRTGGVTYGRFYTATPTTLGFNIPKDVLLKDTSGKSFRTIESRPFPAGGVGPVPVRVQSVLSGLDQHAGTGTISKVLSTIPNAPSDLAVTNTEATFGAGDGEDDSRLRSRARLYYTTARAGTLSAIKRGILAVPGIDTAEVFAAYDERGYEIPLVQAVVSDQFTEQLLLAPVLPAAYDVQSAAIAAQVQASLGESRAAGINVVVVVGRPVMQGVTLSLRFSSTADVEYSSSLARSFIVGYTNSLSGGEVWSRDTAQEYLRRVPGLVVTGGEIVFPTGDIVPRPVELIRTTMGLVNFGFGA